MWRGGVLWLAMLVSCGDDAAVVPHDAAVMPDASTDLFTCSPSCAAGQKCAWIWDDFGSVGHVGCAPAGTKDTNERCTFPMQTASAFGYDDCREGLFCNRGARCVPLCSLTSPSCPAKDTCYRAFTTGSGETIGACTRMCNPLDDNDFDGAGPLTKPGSQCEGEDGCYGIFSGGPGFPSAFWCAPQSAAGRHVHRDPSPANSIRACSPGYQPFLRESTMSSTVVCIAFCKPMNCYSGNCGSNNENQYGAAPHRCNTSDAQGNFGSGEHCEFWWRVEKGSGSLVRSPSTCRWPIRSFSKRSC